MRNNWVFWVLAVVITLSASYYQRATGPTNPKSVQGAGYTLSCPRSMRTDIDPQQAKGDWERLGKTSILNVRIKGKEGFTIPAETPVLLYYKRARTHDEWEMVKGTVESQGRLRFTLPSQPPAGKLAYFLEIDNATLLKDDPVVARFRNNVPAWALIPHILFMYAVMLLSTFCGLLALRNDDRRKKYIYLTLAALFIGGFILGPMIQKFAFGAFWTGWPLGEDLTDTKTLIAACFWIIALLFSNKKTGRALAIIAAIALLVIYSIPHSASGSEFNYETGQVETER